MIYNAPMLGFFRKWIHIGSVNKYLEKFKVFLIFFKVTSIILMEYFIFLTIVMTSDITSIQHFLTKVVYSLQCYNLLYSEVTL